VLIAFGVRVANAAEHVVAVAPLPARNGLVVNHVILWWMVAFA